MSDTQWHIDTQPDTKKKNKEEYLQISVDGSRYFKGFCLTTYLYINISKRDFELAAQQNLFWKLIMLTGDVASLQKKKREKKVAYTFQSIGQHDTSWHYFKKQKWNLFWWKKKH